MNLFSQVVNNLDSIIWSMLLVILCLGVGLYLSVRMGFPQVRYIKEMVRLLVGENDTEHGISPFQAFATTVGARVGMGNIAGVASAIFFGGPGSVFWMWMIAFIGAASAFTESVLAQAYKTKNTKGQLVGGPAYYLEHGLKNKTYAKIFAIVAVLGPGVLLPGVQINSLVNVFEEAFQVNKVIVGVICCILLAIVICGSIQRIAKLAEILAPLMCLVYMTLAIIIIVMNAGKIPGLIVMIVKSAIGIHPIFGAIIGSAISWGVKRGIYSNEAGMGCGAIVSGATECSHPVKQGLVQAFSIYVDTLLVGSATAFIVLLTETYNVSDGVGGKLVDHVGNLPDGILWTQHALMNTYGSWAGKLLAVIIVLFVFSSMTGYCYQAESNVSYLTKDSDRAIWVMRIVFIIASFFGAVTKAQDIWSMGDIGYGLMAWANIIAIAIMCPTAAKLLKDYEKQKKAGKNPMFDPEEFGIEDSNHVWDKYKNQKQ